MAMTMVEETLASSTPKAGGRFGSPARRSIRRESRPCAAAETAASPPAPEQQQEQQEEQRADSKQSSSLSSTRADSKEEPSPSVPITKELPENAKKSLGVTGKAGNATQIRAMNRKLKDIFTAWDTDSSGCICSDELGRVLKELDPNFNDEHIQVMFAAADVNKDGCVDYDEFCDWLCGV